MLSRRKSTTVSPFPVCRGTVEEVVVGVPMGSDAVLEVEETGKLTSAVEFDDSVPGT